MNTHILFFLVLCTFIGGCTNKQKAPTVIGGAKGTTEIIIADKDSTIKDSLPTYTSPQQDDIDSPMPVKEIEQYNKRVTLKRLPAVAITHPNAYTIKTQQPVYSPLTNQIILDVINIDAPTASPEHITSMEQEVDGQWIDFPFIDNLAFAGVGRGISKGDTLPEIINMSIFKQTLKPNKYKVHYYVFTNIYTYCSLTDKNIQPVTGSNLKGAFEFRVLESSNDSLRILFENHTNLPVQPIFLPSVGTDELYTAHPLARSGWSGEYDWMKKHALLKGGEAVLFSIPVSWDVKSLKDPNEKEKFKSGRLDPGKYKIGLQLEIFMSTEFRVI